MKNSLKNLAFSILVLAFANSLRAEDQPAEPAKKPAPAKFSLQLPLLTYTMNSTKTDSDQGSSTEKSNDLATQVLEEGYIGITLGKMALYLYPFDDGNNSVSLAYMVTEDIELGADIGLNKSSSKGDSTLLGVWAYHHMSIGLLNLENGASVSTTTRTNKNPPDPETRSEEFSIKLASNFTYPLARNLRYLGGAFIRNKSQEADGGSKSSTFQFGLILAGIRFRWI